MSSKVQINELRLRVPWSQRDQAKRLGESVAKRLAEDLGETQPPRTIASLNTAVHAGSNASTDQVADEIARSIRNRL